MFASPAGPAAALPSSRAQPFGLEAWSIDGGGTSTAAGFSVQGTIGQPAVGVLAGGDFTVTGGFLGFHVMPAGPVTLAIQMLVNGRIYVRWPADDPGWVLETPPSLAPVAGWQEVTAPGTTSYTAVLNSPARFFRLRQQ